MNPDMYAAILSMGHHVDFNQPFNGLKLLLKALLSKPDGMSEGSNLGSIILLYAPLLFLMRNIPSQIKKLCFVALTIIFLWNITFIQPRFVFAAITLLLIVSGYVLSRVVKTSPYFFRIFIVAGAAFYIFFNISMGFYQVNLRTQTYGLGFLKEPDKQYLLRQMIDNKSALLDSLPVYNYVNTNVAPTAIVLIIGDAQHLYIQRRHRYTYLSGTTPYDIIKKKSGKPEEIAKALRAEGITHIVYSPHEMVRLQRCGAVMFKEKDNIHIEDFLKSQYVKQLYIYRRGQLSVYLFEIPTLT